MSIKMTDEEFKSECLLLLSYSSIFHGHLMNAYHELQYGQPEKWNDIPLRIARSIVEDICEKDIYAKLIKESAFNPKRRKMLDVVVALRSEMISNLVMLEEAVKVCGFECSGETISSKSHELSEKLREAAQRNDEVNGEDGSSSSQSS